LLFLPEEPAIIFLGKQDGLRRNQETASRNGFVSGVSLATPASEGGRYHTTL